MEVMSIESKGIIQIKELTDSNHVKVEILARKRLQKSITQTVIQNKRPTKIQKE